MKNSSVDSSLGFMREPGLVIRRTTEADFDEMFEAYALVVEQGGAFPRQPPANEEMFRQAWLEGKAAVAAARVDGRFAGSYFLQASFPGTVVTIANAGFLVVPELRGRGIGRALAEHSFEQARRLGFEAMMFNLVFERNPSRRLWERLGFEAIGRIPGAGGDQDAIVYWRRL
jgi:GNAT superfamily N-acetyltransferase